MIYRIHIWIFLSFLLLANNPLQAQQHRYTKEIFEEVQLGQNYFYGYNTTVLTQSITGEVLLEGLVLDFYEPKNDIIEDRPLVIYIHSGNFIPHPQNNLTTGSKTDSVNVEIATRLAKMGYVVAIPSYRQGWNPLSSFIEDRKKSYINALYRSVQDIHSCIRFFQKSIDEGNPFGIASDKIVLWGNGSGGTIALAAESIDQYEDLLTKNFIGSDLTPMVDQEINGDPFGTSLGIDPISGDTLSYPNHVGYEYDIDLVVHTGGGLLELDWLDEDDSPMISFQVPDDPFVSYTGDFSSISLFGDPVLPMHGALAIQERVNILENNEGWHYYNWIDDFTASANTCNNGIDGLYPFKRPSALNPITNELVGEYAPWEWWDQEYWSNIPYPGCGVIDSVDCNYHFFNSIHNPLMSAEQGRTYVDSIIGYYIPRACIALELPCFLDDFVNTEDPIDSKDAEISISPNPANQIVYINSKLGYEILEIMLFDAKGSLVQLKEGMHANSLTLSRKNLSPGIYFAKIRFTNGIHTAKIIFD